MDLLHSSQANTCAHIRLFAELTFGSLLLASALSYPLLSKGDKHWSSMSLAIFFISAGFFNILQLPKIVSHGHWTLLVSIIAMIPIMTFGRTTLEEHTRFLPVYTMGLTFLTTAWPSVFIGLGWSPGSERDVDVARPRNLPSWHTPYYGAGVDIESEADALPLYPVTVASTESLLSFVSDVRSQTREEYQPEGESQPEQDPAPDGHHPNSNPDPDMNSQQRPTSPASSSNLAAPGPKGWRKEDLLHRSMILRLTELSRMGPSSVYSQDSHTDTSISLSSAASLPSEMSDNVVEVFFQDVVRAGSRLPRNT